MFKGFYHLTSAMLTQNRNLDIVSNNMANVSTTGYKLDRYTNTTFDEVMRSRVGNKIKQPVELGLQTSNVLTVADSITDHTPGALHNTNLPLDFAIDGEGYFAVQTQDDGIVYTRNGSFMLDDEGYLYLPAQGRVLDNNGQEIMLGTDQIEIDHSGGMFHKVTREYLGTIGLYGFDNPPEQLEKITEGMFQLTGDAQPNPVASPFLHQGMIERSNVDMAQQMTEMIVCQRALQSAAQVTKMYDQLITKTTTDLGRV